MIPALRIALALLLSLPLSSTQTTTVRVAVARAAIHQSASEGSAVVAHLTYGRDLELRGDDGDWYKVAVLVGSVRVEGFLSKHATAVAGNGTGADPAGASPTPSLKVPGISVAADAGGKTTWLQPAQTRVVPVAAAFGTLSEIPTEPVTMAFAGLTRLPADPAADVTWLWAIPRASAPVLASRNPSFFASYRDAPGVNISDITVAVIKVVPAGARWSLVGMARHSAGAADTASPDWTISRELKDATVKTTVRGTASGVMDVRLGALLAPGDYALVLRPFFPRPYAGRDILGGDGMGLLFSYVWPFTIK